VVKASLELYAAGVKQIQEAAVCEEVREVPLTAMASVMPARSRSCDRLGEASPEKTAPILSIATGARRPTAVMQPRKGCHA
jgi:hypothetical protein